MQLWRNTTALTAMMLFERAFDTDGNRHVVALFGMGLIGRSIAASLMREGSFSYSHHPFSWSDARQRQLHADAIKKTIFGQGGDQDATLEIERVDIVWSAGKAGFGSQRADVEPELEAFKDVLAMSEEILERFPRAQHAFHLVSSAGGLFEGQRQVNSSSEPSPKRAYGVLKLQQEVALAATPAAIARLVYRPASVYGYSGHGGRLGLVSALVQNGLRHRVSRIIGEPHTIRDYVLASDIGHFIARRVNEPTGDSRIFTLASGKPSSMAEMLRKIEQALGRRLYLQFDSQPSNASHNSFCQSALPDGWQPTDLDTGIRLTVLELREAFTLP